MAHIRSKELDKLLALLGGTDNITSVSHCISRLRLVLQKLEQPDIKQIEKLPSVKGCFHHQGQLQVIIGPNVDRFYDAFTKILGISETPKQEIKQGNCKNMRTAEQAHSHFLQFLTWPK
ncbi:PTS transporter subunit EIIB [Dongshaea marina]|uniref:PTS transporter subunit EIIB n=1 Tax=Dongshaea marina TaxID=2047966 RepID=UPI00131F16E1|nr:PTS transporter subunit EIIB [Dongshaea marina]